MQRDQRAAGWGTSSSSWLATLRFTSDEEVPPPTTLHGLLLTKRLDRIRSYLVRDPVYSFGVQAGVGVLVCEALRERSEQRANKYRAADCITEQRAVAAQAQLLQSQEFLPVLGRRNVVPGFERGRKRADVRIAEQHRDIQRLQAHVAEISYREIGAHVADTKGANDWPT